jgi:cell division protein FtsW (lipid II flippase)
VYYVFCNPDGDVMAGLVNVRLATGTWEMWSAVPWMHGRYDLWLLFLVLLLASLGLGILLISCREWPLARRTGQTCCRSEARLASSHIVFTLSIRVVMTDLVSWWVVWCCLQVSVCMGGFPVDGIPQWVGQASVDHDIQKG